MDATSSLGILAHHNSLVACRLPAAPSVHRHDITIGGKILIEHVNVIEVSPLTLPKGTSRIDSQMPAPLELYELII